MLLLTILSIAALSVALIAFIAVLGVMREVAMLRGVTAQAGDAHMPSFVGSSLPSGIADLLYGFDPQLKNRSFTLLFVSDGCGSCMSLLDGLQGYVQGGRNSLISDQIVAVAIGGAPSIKDQLLSLEVPTVSDQLIARRLIELGEVEATPSAIRISNPGFIAAEYRSGVGLEWLVSRAVQTRGGALHQRQKAT